MANIPNYTVKNISLGPGILYAGLAGATPSLDIGAIAPDGIEINVKRSFLEVFQGQPKSLIAQFVTQEDVDAKIESLEWNLLNLPIALGSGVTTSSASADTFSFGGDPATTYVAMRVQHATPTGETVSFYFWRCQPTGEWKLSMKEATLHQFPFGFKVLQTTVAWDGSSLPTAQQYFRVIRQKV